MAQGPDVRYLPVVSDIGICTALNCWRRCPFSSTRVLSARNGVAGDWTDDDTRVTGILGQRDLLNWFVRCFLDAGDADILDGTPMLAPPKGEDCS